MKIQKLSPEKAARAIDDFRDAFKLTGPEDLWLQSAYQWCKEENTARAAEAVWVAEALLRNKINNLRRLREELKGEAIPRITPFEKEP